MGWAGALNASLEAVNNWRVERRFTSWPCADSGDSFQTLMRTLPFSLLMK